MRGKCAFPMKRRWTPRAVEYRERWRCRAAPWRAKDEGSVESVEHLVTNGIRSSSLRFVERVLEMVWEMGSRSSRGIRVDLRVMLWPAWTASSQAGLNLPEAFTEGALLFRCKEVFQTSSSWRSHERVFRVLELILGGVSVWAWGLEPCWAGPIGRREVCGGRKGGEGGAEGREAGQKQKQGRRRRGRRSGGRGDGEKGRKKVVGELFVTGGKRQLCCPLRFVVCPSTIPRRPLAVEVLALD